MPAPKNKITQLKAKIATEARRKIADELGVKSNELSPDLTKAVKESVDRQFKASIENRSVNSAVSSVLTKDALGPALKKLNAVQTATVAMPELSTALDKNAELLFKTFRAFVDAGFTDDQAFQIVLTQMKR